MIFFLLSYIQGKELVLRQRNFASEEADEFMRTQEALLSKGTVGTTILDMNTKNRNGGLNAYPNDYQQIKGDGIKNNDENKKRLYNWG